MSTMAASSQQASQSDPRFYFKFFFGKYPNFDYKPLLPVRREFYRMCDDFWPGEKGNEVSPEKKCAREGFRDALVLQFNAIYGSDENNISDWQRLCVVLNLEYVPDELVACREIVQSTYSNLVDLVDFPVTQEPVTLFESERALSEYTKKSGNYFPLENAYAGGLLRCLLRRIRNPGGGLAHPSQRKISIE